MWIELSQARRNDDAVALSAGRALLLCQHFEDGARWILHASELYHRHSPDVVGLDTVAALSEELRGRVLGRIVPRLKAIGAVSLADVELLDRGRVARNYLAHESLWAIHCAGGRSAKLSDALDRYRVAVSDVIAADARLSYWGALIEEPKYPVPRSSEYTYFGEVSAWVLEPLELT